MSSVSVFEALSVISDFDDALTAEERNERGRRNLFIEHLQKMDKLNFCIPGFKTGLDWLNVSNPLSWNKELKDQLVVLDFFTYCCVNCMHILPDLHTLEQTYPPGSGIVVVGVHSAKFTNEQVTANILSAILRYNIKHPVVNDAQASLWQELSISCWPTLLFVGPSNQLLYTLVGEGNLAKMMEFVEVAREYYYTSGQLKPRPLPIALEEKRMEKSILSFPGKVSFWPEQNSIIIADTGNHRIVVVDTHGVVKVVAGSQICGFKDGDFQTAEFSFPQGIACTRDKIYVADTGNHAIRLIDMGMNQVITVAGTGSQGTDKEGGKLSTQQEIASPWDLALGHSKNTLSEPDILYIAAAGTHQIWVYFLQDALWHKGRSFTKGTCIRFAGSGAEENRNNSYPHKAGFAQPSGLTISATTNTMYVADSESSSIRSISLVDGKVSAVVGAEKDPMNLFASGDVDGQGVKAKLQHPLGVAFVSPDGPLLVADSYNHKLKTVDLASNTCETMLLTSKALDGQPNEDPSKVNLFNEPGGLDFDKTSGTVFVADTNNHTIKVVNFTSRTVSQLPLIFPKEEVITNGPDSKHSQTKPFSLKQLPTVIISPDTLSLRLSIPSMLKGGEHLNTEAPNSYNLLDLEESPIRLSSFVSEFNCKGNLKPPDINGTIELAVPVIDNLKPGTTCIFQLKLRFFSCLDEGNACLPPQVVTYRQTVHIR